VVVYTACTQKPNANVLEKIFVKTISAAILLAAYVAIFLSGYFFAVGGFLI
jgi:hypothetical protein